MAFASLLINVCSVQRNTPGAQDVYGLSADSWANLHTDEPCRLMATKGREILIGAEVVIADYTLFIDDIDITEQDRVIIGSVTYEVLLVGTRQDSTSGHHKECFMRTVR